MKPTVKTIASQPSWVIRSADVELAVTQLGGHMAPVTFYRRSPRPARPYYVSPWQGEGLKIDHPVLVPLRGDFFCAPFGANEQAYRGEQHRCHGEVAGRKWRLVSAERNKPATTLTLSIKTTVRPGKVTKRLTLIDAQNVVYSTHTLEGYDGAMPMGHHATLAMPDEPESVLVATGAIRFGMTNPAPAPPGEPLETEYNSLASNRRFSRLDRVPLIWKAPAWGDCSRFPTREGYTDVLAVYSKPAKVAWTAATFTTEGFVWFSLKDPAVLPATTFWMSNRGRQGPPWNGRNRCLGLEDVCGYFAQGLAASARRNSLNAAGIPTVIKLSPKRPTVINYIQGVVKAPRGFARVASASFKPSSVTFKDESGKSVTAAVRHEFLADGRLP